VKKVAETTPLIEKCPYNLVTWQYEVCSYCGHASICQIGRIGISEETKKKRALLKKLKANPELLKNVPCKWCGSPIDDETIAEITRGIIKCPHCNKSSAFKDYITKVVWESTKDKNEAKSMDKKDSK
jgi:hypothetical protein